MRIVCLGLIFASRIAMGQPPLWKEFSLAPAAKLDKPLEKTVEWTFEPSGSKVAYPACCPWLDVEGGFGRLGNDPWSLHANGTSIKSLLSRMEGLPQVRIVAPDWMTRERYELKAVVSDEYRLRFRRREEGVKGPREELRILVKQELVDRMQIRMHRERRDTTVSVVKAMEGTTPKLGQADAGSWRGDGAGGLQAWARDGAFQTTNANDFILLTWLQNVVKRPVYGEGLPAGPYRIEVHWKAGNARSLATALWEQLGLALVEDRREVEFLVVDYALKPEWR